MRYVQARNGVFERHINDTQPTRWDENNYCFARKLDPVRAAMLGVYKLKIVTPPYFDPATQKRVEKDAILVDGTWTQVYAVESLSSDEAAQVAAVRHRPEAIPPARRARRGGRRAATLRARLVESESRASR